MNFKNYEIPKKTVDAVVDTDMSQNWFNGKFVEVDDEFALAYLLKCEKINLKAIYTDVSRTEEYEHNRILAVKNVLRSCHREDLMSSIYTGARNRMSDNFTPVESKAVDDLIERANKYTNENPLYVVEIGPLTNIASALIREPSIAEKIVIVAMGGHEFEHEDTKEYNLTADWFAAQYVFKTDVPLVLIPGINVSKKAVLKNKDVLECLAGTPIGDYLIWYLRNMFKPENFENGARIMWDVVPICWFMNENNKYLYSKIVERPLLTDDGHYDFIKTDKRMVYVYDVNEDVIIEDLLSKLETYSY